MTGVTPDALTAFVMAYEEVNGGAATRALSVEALTGMIVGYAEAAGISLSSLSSSQLTALITAFAEATGCDKTALTQSVTAYITAYDTESAPMPTVRIKVGVYGYDMIAYNEFVANNPVTVSGIVRLGEVYTDPTSVKGADNVTYWKDGVEIPVSAVPVEQLTADTLAVLDADGTMHVLITP